MAKGVYVGVDGVARKSRNAYVGVDNVARKIKKAYVGIGGVARPCWNDGVTHYGEITPLSVARSDIRTATLGDTIFFIGGETYAGSYTPVVDVYNEDLTKTTTEMSIQRGKHACGTISNNVIIGGGRTANNGNTAIVESFDSDLVRTILTNFTYARRNLACAFNERYVLFAGGTSGSLHNTVDAYNEQLTRVNANTISQQRSHLSGGTVGVYAMIAGGIYKSNSNSYNSIIADVFDTELTRTKATNLSTGRHSCDSCTIGNKVLFGGGALTNTSGSEVGVSAVVDTYDTTLTKGVAPELSYARQTVGASFGSTGAFVGGANIDSKSVQTPCGQIDVYDSELTLKSNLVLTTPRRSHGAAGTKRHILVGGGIYTDVLNPLTSVEALII